MIAVASPAYSRGKKPQPTPTATLTPTATPTPETKVWNFDEDKAHEVASGWEALEGNWEVIADPSAPSQPNTFGLPPGRLITSLMKGLDYHPIAMIKDPTEYGDFTLEVSFKPVKGRFDCSGGLIFRYSGKNYYLLSAGCPSDFISVIRVTADKSEVLEQKVVPIDANNWYRLKLVAEGNRFTVYLDDKMVFGLTDAKIEKGRIGLWAANDSQVRYDNLTLTLPLASAAGAAPAPGAEASPAPPPPPPPPPPAH